MTGEADLTVLPLQESTMGQNVPPKPVAAVDESPHARRA